MPILFNDAKKDLPSEQLYRLFRAVGWANGTEADAQKIHFNKPFINSTLVVSAWDGDCLVGAARVLSDRIVRSMLHDLVVAPEYQRKGIGQELLKRCIGHFPYSEWLIPTNAETAGFYKTFGFGSDERVFLTISSKYFQGAFKESGSYPTHRGNK